MIKLTEEYYIKADPRCYILCKKSKDKKENDIYINELYYTTIKGCIDGVIKRKGREFLSKEVIQSLKQLKDYMKTIEDEIVKNLDGVDLEYESRN